MARQARVSPCAQAARLFTVAICLHTVLVPRANAMSCTANCQGIGHLSLTTSVCASVATNVYLLGPVSYGGGGSQTISAVATGLAASDPCTCLDSLYHICTAADSATLNTVSSATATAATFGGGCPGNACFMYNVNDRAACDSSNDCTAGSGAQIATMGSGCTHNGGGSASPVCLGDQTNSIHFLSASCQMPGDGVQCGYVCCKIPATVTSATRVPTAGGLVTVTGTNFQTESVDTVNIGSGSCTAVTVSSETELTCTVPAGSGKGIDVEVSTSTTKKGTGAGVFSYDVPTVATVTRGFADGSGTVTITGTNFGTTDPTPTVTIAGGTCGAVSWQSDTIVKCQPPAGVGTGKELLITITSQSNAANTAHSYQLPVVSSATGALNDASQLTTISGRNFGGTDSSPTVTVNGATCSSPAWQSDTEIRCTPAANAAAPSSVDVIVTVSGQSGTGSGVFSYTTIAATVTAATTSPTAGGTVVTVDGTNFGNTDPVFTATIDGNACGSATYVDATRMTCTAPPGAGSGLAVMLTKQSGATSATNIHFSYDPPTITSAGRAATAGGAFTITGTNFGGVTTTTVGVTVSGHTVSSASHLSNTQVEAVVGPGEGGGISIVVTVAGQSVTQASAFSFKVPSIGSFEPPVSVTAGDQTITIDGSNMGTSAPTATLMSSCAAVTGTRATCVSSSGVTGSFVTPQSVAITVASQASAAASFYFQDCNAGQYQDSSLAASPYCSNCQAGYYGDTAGAVSSAVCKPCLPGTYSSGGQSSCPECARGEWSCLAASACTDDDSSTECCGNGYVEETFFLETCDDGNTVPGDGCDNLCKREESTLLAAAIRAAPAVSGTVTAMVLVSNLAMANTPAGILGFAGHMQNMMAVTAVGVDTIPTDSKNMAAAAGRYFMLLGPEPTSFLPLRRLLAKADGSDGVQGSPDDSMLTTVLWWTLIFFMVVLLLHGIGLVLFTCCCRVILRQHRRPEPYFLRIPYIEVLFLLVSYQALSIMCFRVMASGQLSLHLVPVAAFLAFILFLVPVGVALFVCALTRERQIKYTSHNEWIPLVRAYYHCCFVVSRILGLCRRRRSVKAVKDATIAVTAHPFSNEAGGDHVSQDDCAPHPIHPGADRSISEMDTSAASWDDDEESSVRRQPGPRKPSSFRSRAMAWLVGMYHEFNISGEWDVEPAWARLDMLFADYMGHNRFFLAIDLMVKFLRGAVIGIVGPFAGRTAAGLLVAIQVLLMLHAICFGLYTSRHQTYKEIYFLFTSTVLALVVVMLPEEDMVWSKWSASQKFALTLVRYVMLVNIYTRFAWEAFEFVGKLAGKVGTVSLSIQVPKVSPLRGVMAVIKCIFLPCVAGWELLSDLFNTLFGSDDAIDIGVEVMEDEAGVNASGSDDEELLGAVAALTGANAALVRDTHVARVFRRRPSTLVDDIWLRTRGVSIEHAGWAVHYILNSVYCQVKLPLDAEFELLRDGTLGVRRVRIPANWHYWCDKDEVEDVTESDKSDLAKMTVEYAPPAAPKGVPSPVGRARQQSQQRSPMPVPPMMVARMGSMGSASRASSRAGHSGRSMQRTLSPAMATLSRVPSQASSDVVSGWGGSASVPLTGVVPSPPAGPRQLTTGPMTFGFRSQRLLSSATSEAAFSRQLGRDLGGV